MSSSYFDYAMEHVRLAVLRSLTEAPSRSANDSILANLMAELGLPVTRDQLRSQLAWLEEQGLIRTARPTSTVLTVTVRERGEEVALGLVVVPGIQRPSALR